MLTFSTSSTLVLCPCKLYKQALLAISTSMTGTAWQMQEAELLEGAEELERLERQVRSSPGRASQSFSAAASRRSSGAHADAEQPLLDT